MDFTSFPLFSWDIPWRRWWWLESYNRVVDPEHLRQCDPNSCDGGGHQKSIKMLEVKKKNLMAVGVTLFARFAARFMLPHSWRRDSRTRLDFFESIAHVSFPSADYRQPTPSPPGLFVARRTQQTELPTYLKTGNFIFPPLHLSQMRSFLNKSYWNVECLNR